MTRSLAGALSLPDGMEALVFDMDGVLLDTLGGDFDLCVAAAGAVLGDHDWLDRRAVATHFALDPPHFWDALLRARAEPVEPAARLALVADYDRRRRAATFAPIAGAVRVLKAARAAGMPTAVASSNGTEIVRDMLARADLAAKFDAITGIEGPEVRPKPAPDIYRNACAALGVDPLSAAFIEDSPTGLKAGRAAGLGHAVAVATGAASFATLFAGGLADQVFDRFDAPSVAFFDGDPMRKTIDTPDDFVSHMIEHIAWRLGVGVDLHWRNGDWRALGTFVGGALRDLGLRAGSAATLGMIDDGAAETLIDLNGAPGVAFDVHPTLSAQKVLAMRVEQVRAGRELIDLLEGLASGLKARIAVRMCTFEDPHHSWEGVFRAVGIGLARLKEVA